MLIEPYLALDEAQAESRRSSVTVPGEPLASLLYPAPATATGAAETEKEKSNQVIISPHFSSELLTFGNQFQFSYLCKVASVWSKEQQDHANKLYALWIAGSYLPVTMAKDQGFHRFMRGPSRGGPLSRLIHFCECLSLIAIHELIVCGLQDFK